MLKVTHLFICQAGWDSISANFPLRTEDWNCTGPWRGRRTQWSQALQLMAVWKLGLVRGTAGLCHFYTSQTWTPSSENCLERRHGEESCYYVIMVKYGLSRWLSCKESACQAGDAGSIPGSGRSSEEGNGNSLQYSCLGNPMDRGAWRAIVYGVAKRVRYDLVTKQQ